jgi:N-acetylmuramoyl-L-alanine amidase
MTKMKTAALVKCLILVCVATTAFSQSKFKVTLDAGHGDHDYGAVYNGHIEKNITLAVALKVGKILEKSGDIEVIYTRKSDQFIDLIERANMANRADANLFVSIHCNANKNPAAEGCETYVLGMSKNASNLEAAKRENAVVALEKDYLQKYEGFDPKSSEPFKLPITTAESDLDQSILLAGKIQNHFIDELDRKSRGVKQGPFLLLNKAYMPKVIIEMGFLSNPQEGAKLDSDEGQDGYAQAIANAIISFKKENFKTNKGAAEKPSEKLGNDKSYKPSDSIPSSKAVVKTTDPKKPEAKKLEPKEAPKPEPVATGEVTFKVQLSASGKLIDTTPSNFKGLSSIGVTSEGTLYKYTYGNTANYDEAKRLLADAKAKGYTSAFIIAFKGGKKVSVQEALKR